MNNPPSMDRLCEKIRELLRDHIEVEGEIRDDAALMEELNLDSLDMIEFSFALEEFFGFEFASKDAFEALDAATEGAILKEGSFTELGKDMVIRRAPELKTKALPTSLSPMVLQKYYSIETFARLIREFYLAAPETCPRTGEVVVEKEFKITSEKTGQPVGTRTGDEILDVWVAEMSVLVKQSET